LFGKSGPQGTIFEPYEDCHPYLLRSPPSLKKLFPLSISPTYRSRRSTFVRHPVMIFFPKRQVGYFLPVLTCQHSEIFDFFFSRHARTFFTELYDVGVFLCTFLPSCSFVDDLFASRLCDSVALWSLQALVTPLLLFLSGL